MLRGSVRLALLLVLCFAGTSQVFAGGPRFVTGSNYPNVKPGTPMAFYTAQPAYFTDAGDLSSTVTHAQADAMVALAAAVWNVPTTSLTLAQGGVLAEHVSSANSYFDGTQIVFPPDVQSANYLSAPIAVIYDTDGSITDLMLGEGASDPGGCRQTGVTESVDAFGQDGTIHHAIVVLNGRCIDSATARPQQLLQMQYQLTRVFGRVLGMGWSQLNDNVFTDVTQPTAAEEAYWPLMHPIDVLCSSYTYQCMQNPFLLRDDDISALMLLYPITSAALAAGKYYSYSTADIIGGGLYFPTGQGMEEVNLTLRRGTTTEVTYEPWEMVSALSGYQFQSNGGNPITGPVPIVEDVGSSDPSTEGTFYMASVEVTLVWSDITFLAEPINPLYTGDYAIGAYQGPVRSVSGTPQPFYGTVLSPFNYYGFNSTIAGAAAVCNPGNDGTETAPAPSDPTGLWSGQICGIGHTSWWSATIQPNRTWTLETTALDDSGRATTQKLQPVLGVWNASDAPGMLPTVASAAAPLNALSLGMTQLQMPSSTNPQTLRIAIADAYGAGRPDFNYTARLLYADSIYPATLGSSGGQITLTGTGFRPGNQVLVNGVPATVLTLTSTQIVAQAPSMALADPNGVAVDVEVLDRSTAGSTTLQAALTYSPAAPSPVLAVAIAAILPRVPRLRGVSLCLPRKTLFPPTTPRLAGQRHKASRLRRNRTLPASRGARRSR
jgi:hypothetical protein